MMLPIIWALLWAMPHGAYNTGMVLADKPYKVTWTVNFGGWTANRTHSRRFSEYFPAWQFYLNAPRCLPSTPAVYPCVEKIELFTIYTTDDPKA